MGHRAEIEGGRHSVASPTAASAHCADAEPQHRAWE